MSPDDVIRLRHMAEAAESALRFCQGRTRADVDTDDMLRFALTRAVEIIGEAANKVSIEARTQIDDGLLVASGLIAVERNVRDFESALQLGDGFEGLMMLPHANVLFYGPPGTGKTELAKAIAAKLGKELFEILFADLDGDSIRGEKRLRAASGESPARHTRQDQSSAIQYQLIYNKYRIQY